MTKRLLILCRNTLSDICFLLSNGFVSLYIRYVCRSITDGLVVFTMKSDEYLDFRLNSVRQLLEILEWDFSERVLCSNTYSSVFV